MKLRHADGLTIKDGAVQQRIMHTVHRTDDGKMTCHGESEDEHGAEECSAIAGVAAFIESQGREWDRLWNDHGDTGVTLEVEGAPNEWVMVIRHTQGPGAHKA